MIKLLLLNSKNDTNFFRLHKKNTFGIYVSFTMLYENTQTNPCFTMIDRSRLGSYIIHFNTFPPLIYYSCFSLNTYETYETYLILI